MPFMQAQILRIDFAESKEKHEEDEPRQDGFQGQKPPVAEGTYQHREPEGIGIKGRF